MALLRIKNLKVKVEGKKILKGVNWEIQPGEIQALLGPNASGKSTLAAAIAGIPQYQITGGEILFENKNITQLVPEERVKLGIVLGWQSPPAIKGVKLSRFLDRIAKVKIKNERVLNPKLLKRELNVNFSGGEKKMAELSQILALKPKLVIFDEIDSGLDIKRLAKAAKIIKNKLIKKGVAVLLITHWGQILQFLKPQITNVMVKGKIVCREKNYQKILKTIKKYGYEKCKKCPFPAN